MITVGSTYFIGFYPNGQPQRVDTNEADALDNNSDTIYEVVVFRKVK